MFRPAFLFLLALPLLWPVVATAEISVAGRLLDSAGDPLAGARVRLEPLPGSFPRALLRLDGRPGPEAVATETTDASGFFELQAPDAGMWSVVVEARGRLTMECRLVPLVETVVLPDLTLPAAETLEIHLLSEGGEPRPGWVGAQSAEVRGPWRPRMRLATAGPDGRARLPVGAGENLRLEALAEGHPLVEKELVAERSLRLEVPEGVTHQVRFLGRGRRPAAGVIAVQGSGLLPLGRSAEDGRLEVVLQSRDPLPLKALTEDLWHGTFELEPKSSGRERALRLEPPERLEGRVLDLATRDPVADAWVWSVRGEATRTDERGQYSLERGIHRSSRVRAVAAGYRRGDSRIEAGSAPAAIGLAATASVSGRVLDEEGRRLEGVAYGARLRSSQPRFRSSDLRRWMYDQRTSKTGADGRFVVAGLPTGVDLEIFFEAPGFAPDTLEIEPLERFQSRADLEIRLGAGIRARGRVVDSADVPVASAEIELRAARSGNVRFGTWRHRAHGRETDEPPLLSDAEGRFEVADLAPGRYDLSIRASGFAPTRVPGLSIAPEPQIADLGTVVLAPGATLRGRVVDPEGEALEDATVVVEAAGRGFGSDMPRQDPVSTDSHGEFEITDLVSGQAIGLVAGKKGFGGTILPVVVETDGEPLQIVLTPAGDLRGRVVDPEGRAIEGAVVRAYPAGRSQYLLARSLPSMRSLSARTSADGSFRLTGVPPEGLQLQINAEGYQQQVRSDLQVPAGGEAEIEIVLEPGAVVEGTVTRANGDPVARLRVQITQAASRAGNGHETFAAGATDLEGRFRVTGVPIGEVSVNLHSQGGQLLQKSLEVSPGVNVIDLVLESGHEVSGQVVDAQGIPVANAAISLQLVRSFQERAQVTGTPDGIVSDADGNFTLLDIGAGEYQLTATREGFARARTENLEVRADVRGVLLELQQGATLSGRVLGLELDEIGSLSLHAFGGNSDARLAELDYSGTYRLEHLAPGTWQVYATVARTGRTATVEVEIPEGTLEVEKDLELGSGYTLSGIVLLAGQPVPWAKIHASGSGHTAVGITDATGTFRIESLPEGTHQLSVTLRDERIHREQVELDRDLDVRIEIPTGALGGVVLGAGSGEPLPGAEVSLEPLIDGALPDPSQPWSYTRPRSSNFEGRFEFTNLRPGRYRLVVSKSGFGPEERVIDVGEGATSPGLEILLSPTEGVTFEVALASGEPLPLVQIALVAPGTGQSIHHDTYPVRDGRVEIDTVPPGLWDLAIQGGDSASIRFRVSSPGDQGLLVLPQGGALQLRVPELEAESGIVRLDLRGPDGQPFLSATHRAPLGAGHWPMQAGQVVVTRLAPGPWTLTVDHLGQTWSGVATILAGQTTEVTLP